MTPGARGTTRTCGFSGRSGALSSSELRGQWTHQGSNLAPLACRASALPAELCVRAYRLEHPGRESGTLPARVVLQLAAGEPADHLRCRGVEPDDVEHAGVVRVGDGEAVRDHSDHDQPCRDAGAL